MTFYRESCDRCSLTHLYSDCVTVSLDTTAWDFLCAAAHAQTFFAAYEKRKQRGVQDIVIHFPNPPQYSQSALLWGYNTELKLSNLESDIVLLMSQYDSLHWLSRFDAHSLCVSNLDNQRKLFKSLGSFQHFKLLNGSVLSGLTANFSIETHCWIHYLIQPDHCTWRRVTVGTNEASAQICLAHSEPWSLN